MIWDWLAYSAPPKSRSRFGDGILSLREKPSFCASLCSTTHSLAAAVAMTSRKPSVFVCGLLGRCELDLSVAIHVCLHPSTCKDTRACQVLRVWLQASPDSTPSPPAPTPPAPTSATPTPTGLSTLPTTSSRDDDAEAALVSRGEEEPSSAGLYSSHARPPRADGVADKGVGPGESG